MLSGKCQTILTYEIPKWSEHLLQRATAVAIDFSLSSLLKIYLV